MLDRIKIIFLSLAIVAVIVTPIFAQKIMNACEMPASTWMKLDADSRMIFVTGYIAGIDQTARFMGGKIVQTGNMNYGEMGETVYRHLLAHPELREGPIGEIILDALRGRLVLTDKFGNPYKSK